MKLKIIWGVLVLAGLPIVFSACDKDDEVKKSGISFELAEQKVKESNGTLSSFHPELFNNSTGQAIEVKIILDRALASDAVVKLKVEGTASLTPPSEDEVNDFDIKAGTNTTVSGTDITIAKGSTEASIILQVYEDFDLEYYSTALDNGIPFETVILTLDAVTSGPLQIGEQKTYTLKISEDDAVVILEWDPADVVGNNPGDVDMDILIYLGSDLVGGSAQEGQVYEVALIAAGYPNGKYDISYPYYSGTSNNLDFFASFLNFGGTINGGGGLLEYTYTAKYTQANINEWSFPTPNTKIAQSFTKNGFNITNVTGITVHTEGSRMKSRDLNLENLINTRDGNSKLKVIKPSF